jgi:ATP-dependent Clp protease ATP-binding subunit ClpB
VLRSKAGLPREIQPTGSFLFLGAAGVGKTALANACDERHLVRLNMAQYTEPDSVSRLIDAPSCLHFGHDEGGGQLTEAVRRRPYTVVLFDEIEKAHHRRVLTVLLQLVNEGRLTDSKGRTVDFTNTVIMLTSNIGAQALVDLTGDDTLEKREGTRDTHDCHKRCSKPLISPDFINKLSAIVLFNSLGTTLLEKIPQKSGSASS